MRRDHALIAWGGFSGMIGHMSLYLPTPKSLFRGSAIACSILASCIAANGQNAPSDAELNVQVNLFKEKAFAHSADSPDSYYIGPFPESTLVCSDVFRDNPRVAKTCEMVVEMHARSSDPYPF